MNTVLITGGSGYIGTHLCYQLLKNNINVVIVDNFSNSNKTAIRRCSKLSNCPIVLVDSDINDISMLNFIFRERKIDAVFHLAGLKSVPQSITDPLKYYANNISGTLSLLRAMKESNINKLIFSSSATVYDSENKIPFSENGILKTTNPYGMTKLVSEQMIKDHGNTDLNFKYVILRYFNPIGAHPSGLMGEDSSKGSTNLMPILCDVALRKRHSFVIYGKDFNTVDGTPVRDYIHIDDLCRGHINALNSIDFLNNITLNLGSGVGTSVLQLVNKFAKVNDVEIPIYYDNRRDGDVATMVADISLAKTLLQWQPLKTIEDACKTAYQWAKKNPKGYPLK